MANCQYNMRYSRRPMANPAPPSPQCGCRMEGCPDTHDHFPEDMPIAMAYVPWQKWKDLYDPCKALQCGTIFSELDKPFLGKGGRRR